MKMFIWPDFDEDYSPGLAVAVAETVEQAREILLREIPSSCQADVLLVEPQIKELPCCAFCHGGA